MPGPQAWLCPPPPARGRGRIPRVQFGEEADEILQRASEAIDRPRGNHVDFAGGCGFEQPIEPRSLGAPLCTADAIVGKLSRKPVLMCFHYCGLIEGELRAGPQPSVS